MSFTRGAYSPTDGLKNSTSFPTTPASEAAMRKQFQDVFDQILTLLNGLMTALESVTTGSSGAENIGSAAIASVTGTTVRAQIADLKAQIDAISAGSVSDGAITTAKLANDAVDGTKLADDSVDSEHIVAGAIDTEHLAGGSVTAAKLGSTAILEANIANGAVTENKIGTGAVTENKIGTGAVTQTKIANGSITSAKLANGSITSAKLDADARSSVNQLWTGAWPVGSNATIPYVEAFSRILVEFSGGVSSIILSRFDLDSTTSSYRGTTAGGLSGGFVTAKISVVSGNTLKFDSVTGVSFVDGGTANVTDYSISIVTVYGMY